MLKTGRAFILHDGRWQRDHNPDLCFVTSNNNDEPLQTSRCVLNDFPHSQHRPVLITVGIQIPLSDTIQKPRWNFQKADWKTFQNQVRIEQTVRWIPPSSNNYQRFVGAIKSAAKSLFQEDSGKNIPDVGRVLLIICLTNLKKAQI
jgi:hypothetical protein